MYSCKVCLQLHFDFCVAKPCPPEYVKIRKNGHAYFQYDIFWEMPECEWNYAITNYTVQALMLRDSQEANFCSCSPSLLPDDMIYAFLAGCSGINLDYTLYYRVAANTESAGQSDFTHGEPTGFAAGVYVHARFTIV